MIKNVVPPVAFLGVCERAEHFCEDQAITWYHNFLGLKTNLVSYIYPSNFIGINLLFAVYDPKNFKGGRAIFIDSKENEVLKVNFNPINIDKSKIDKKIYPSPVDIPIQIQELIPSWSLSLYKVNTNVTLLCPDKLRIFF